WDWNPARLPTLPLLATGLAGEWREAGSGVELTQVRWDQVIDRLARPPSLAADRDAYALTVVGDSMWPRFKPGMRIAVSPRLPVAIGDDVIVLLQTSEANQPVLIKALVKRSNGEIELRQFNPDLAFNVQDTQIDAIHK